MKIHITIDNNGNIIPVDEMSISKVKKMSVGEVYDCNIDGERVRSNPQNARYWSRLARLCEMIPESWAASFARNMLDQLTLESIDVETMHEYLKLKAGVASIAFDRMSHADACDFYRFADVEIETLEMIAMELRQ